MRSQAPALLIIDMQQGMRSPKAGKRNNPQAESHIARLLSAWRQAGGLIVHIRHMSRTPGSSFWPGQPGAEFQEELKPLAREYVVEKNVPDAFVHTGLERWLRVRDVAQIVIVGVSTNNSVEATARTAGNLGFCTRVVSDGTFTFDKVDYSGTPRTAAEVHAMSLANLDGEYASIVTTEEALKLLYHAHQLDATGRSGSLEPNDAQVTRRMSGVSERSPTGRMRSHTLSVFIAASPARVYAFASNPANLPLWVPSFCTSVALANGEWVVQSPTGRVVFAFIPPNALGVLDHTVTLPSGEKLTNPMRVVPNGDGSEVLFTLLHHEGMSDQQFREDAALVRRDLETLRRVLEGSGG